MTHNLYPIIEWLENLLKERFKVELRLIFSCGNYVITLEGMNSSIIFDRLNSQFFNSNISLSYAEWDAVKQGWSALIGAKLPMPGGEIGDSILIEKQDKNYLIHYDILGLAFWMLTRIEEIDSDNLDEHGRFQGAESHAYRYGYLYRPIVDEWFNILEQVMLRIWPNALAKSSTPSLIMTCDVDNPFAFDVTLQSLPKRLARNLIRQRSISAALNTCRYFVSNNRYQFKDDPYIKNIYWIMDVNEQFGNQVIFYFLAGGSHKFDASYSVEDCRIKTLIVDIIARGHKIGLHPSYDSYRNPEILNSEVLALRKILNDLGLAQIDLESRQHFLRWDPTETPNFLQNAGVNCDSSLGYADFPGFRCGTAHEYSMFDVKNKKSLKIRQRPLIVMESSLIEHRYMGLGYSDAMLEYILRLKSNVVTSGGQFVILWHNSSFEKPKAYSIYRAIL